MKYERNFLGTLKNIGVFDYPTFDATNEYPLLKNFYCHEHRKNYQKGRLQSAECGDIFLLPHADCISGYTALYQLVLDK